MRWLITFVIACIVFNAAQGWLTRIGLGRLPGDFKLRIRGRDWYFPIGSSVLIAGLMTVISLLI